MTFKYLLLCTVLACPAYAQDLYEAPIDPNASFVRIVAPGETLAVINGTTFDSLQGGITPFLVVDPGSILVTVGGHEAKAEIAAASFYTFSPAEDGTLYMLQDSITNSPAKADLVIYNQSDLPLIDLFAPAVDAMVLDGIAPATSRQVSLKAPLTLDLEVQSDGVVLAKLPAVTLERRAGVTVIFSGRDGAYSAQSSPNTYAN